MCTRFNRIGTSELSRVKHRQERHDTDNAERRPQQERKSHKEKEGAPKVKATKQMRRDKVPRMRPNGTPMPGGEIMDRLSKWYRARAKDGAAVKINPPVELRLPGTSEGRIPTEYNYVLFPPTKESSSASQNTTENTVSPDDNANQKECALKTLTSF